MSIASEIQALQNDKTAIANAITAKGVTVPSGSGFDDFAAYIGAIPKVIKPTVQLSSQTDTLTITCDFEPKTISFCCPYPQSTIKNYLTPGQKEKTYGMVSYFYRQSTESCATTFISQSDGRANYGTARIHTITQNGNQWTITFYRTATSTTDFVFVPTLHYVFIITG